MNKHKNNDVTSNNEDEPLDVIKALGLFASFNKKVNLKSFNEFLLNLGFKKINSNQLNDMLVSISHEGEELNNYYQYKAHEGTPIELLIHRKSFTTDKGLTFNLSKDKIIYLIKLIQSHSELKNGNFNEKQFYKLANKEINLSHSDDLLEYLFDVIDKLAELNSVINDSDKQNEIVYNSNYDLVSRMNMKQRELQNLSRKYNKLKREVLDDSIFRKQVINYLPKIKITKPVAIKDTNKKDSKRTLVVCLSDIHVGLKTNDFDLKTIKERLNQYVSYIKLYIDNHNINQVQIINLGDNIENEYMHLNQMASVEFTLSEQVANAIQTIIEFIQNVRNLGVKVSYTGIAGNHDRLNPNKKQNEVGDTMNKILNITINNFAKDLDIKYLEPIEEIRTYLAINGLNIAITHGDYDKLSNKDILNKLSVYFNQKMDIVLGGHFHNLMINTLGENQYAIQSGSLFTGNPYSNSLGVTANASQIMLDIDKNGKFQIIPIIF